MSLERGEFPPPLPTSSELLAELGMAMNGVARQIHEDNKLFIPEPRKSGDMDAPRQLNYALSFEIPEDLTDADEPLDSLSAERQAIMFQELHCIRILVTEQLEQEGKLTGKSRSDEELIVRMLRNNAQFIERRDTLVETNQGLVERVLNSQEQHGLSNQIGDRDDALQIGFIGLTGAVEGYRPDNEMDAPFAVLACMTVASYIKNYYYDPTWIPHAEYGERKIISRHYQQLLEVLGRQPNVEEIIESMAVHTSELMIENSITFADQTTYEGEFEDMVIDRTDIELAMGKLDARQHEVVRMYYSSNKQPAEIAAALGTSTQAIASALAEAHIIMRRTLQQTRLQGSEE